METPPPTSTPTDPPPPQPPSGDPPRPLSTPSDPPPTAPPTEPSPPPSTSATPLNPTTPQTLEPQSQPEPQPPPPQQQPPAIPRPRPPAQSIPRGGAGGGGSGSSGGGPAIGVPAGYSHHQRSPSSPSPFPSFRPSHPFGGPSPSFGQHFASIPRTFPGGPDQAASSAAQARQPVPGVQTIGMIGSLSTAPTASQMRPGGAPGQNPQRLGQPLVRSASSSANQANSQKFPSHVGPRGPSITSPSSQAAAQQNPPPHHQQWMSAQGKQTHASSLSSSSYRPPMKPPIMQQRPQHPQQQQQHMPTTSHHLQVSASSQQQQQQQKQQLQQLHQMQQPNSLPNQSQEHHPLMNQPSIPQYQAARALMPTTPKSNIQALVQPGLSTSTPSTEADEFSNDIISRKRIRELVTQVDRSEKLRPEIEDDLLEIADDFIGSIVTAACHLAKHRKSTTLEAKDILLHVERHWNMNLPGFSGDEIKCYKKPSANDIHKERLAMIKKSMAVTHDVGNPKTPASATGQASANPKLHSAKPPAMPSPKAREPP